MNKDYLIHKHTGMVRILKAMGYSLKGLRVALFREAAFRQEVLLCLFLIPAAFWWGTTSVEKILLVASCVVVLITELLNSAVEAVVDRVGLESHELSALAKDYGSAAVFISLVLVLFVWTMIGVDRWV